MSAETFLDGRVTLHAGDSRDVSKKLADNSVDSIVTDPPYALVSIVKRFGGANAAPAKGNTAYMRASAGFMGKTWDTGEVAFSEEFWAEVMRVLKPGGHVAAFGASRGYHRMACAIEDAGFEIRDSLMWVYGTGFPKSHDVSKGIDKRPGVTRHAEFAADLKAAMAANGYTNTFDVAEKVVGRRTGAVANWQKYQFPEAKWWPVLRDLLGMDGKKWDAVIAETERVKLGARGGNLLAVAPGQDNDRSATMLDITAPATDAAREWEGWGTALKPAFEPIVLARKPLSEGTVAANVLRWGTGALNIDGCRIAGSEDTARPQGKDIRGGNWSGDGGRSELTTGGGTGRWPANVVHDGSDEVVGAFPVAGGQQGRAKIGGAKGGSIYGKFAENISSNPEPRGDSGSAARFFFNSKETDEQWLARNLPNAPANLAEKCFSLQSELVASVLRNAADLSTLELVPRKTDSAEPSMSATPNELRQISDILIETMQSFERKSSLESLHERLSLSGSPARFVATRKPTGTITITISHSKSDGSAAPVTFSITPQNLAVGAKDCAPSTTRFHYSAKASKADRAGSKHPTVKPIKLNQWIARLITPPGGTVLDPFAGSGTTGAACALEGFNCILIEREDEYVEDIRRRMALCMSGPEERKRESIKAKVRDVPFEPGSLFAGIEEAE